MELSEKALRALEKLGESNSSLAFHSAESLEQFTKELQSSVKRMKESNTIGRMFNDAASGSKIGLIDITSTLEDLDEQLEKSKKAFEALDEEAKKAAAADQDSIERETRKAKVTATAIGVMKNLTAVGLNYANSFLTSQLVLVDAAQDFASALAKGAKGPELYNIATIAAAKSSWEMQKANIEVKKGMGDLVSVLSFFLPGGFIVKGLVALGGQLFKGFESLQERVGEKQLDLFVKGQERMLAIFNKFESSFREVSSAGNILAQGMTGLLDASVNAQMDIKDFADGVKKSTDSIYHMGIGSSQAIKRMSDVSKELRKEGSDAAKQLYAMGYSAEEQVALSADVMADYARQGKLRSATDAQLAKSTVDYATNLKVLNQITGGQAKEALKKAREEQMESGFQALIARSGKGAADVLLGIQPILEKFGPTISSTIKEILQTGTSTNTAGLVAIQNNQELMTGIQRMTQAVHEGTMGQTNATEMATDILHKAADQYKKLNESGANQGIISAGILSQQGITREVMQAENELMKAGLLVTEQQNKDNKEAIDKQKSHLEKLDDNYVAFSQSVDQMTAEFNKNMLPRMQDYTAGVKTINEMWGALKNDLVNIDTYLKNFGTGGLYGGPGGGGGGASDDGSARQMLKYGIGGLGAVGGSIAGIAAAPFTGGASLAAEGALIGAGGAGGYLLGDYIADKLGLGKAGTAGGAPVIPAGLSTNGREGNLPITSELQDKLNKMAGNPLFAGSVITGLNDSNVIGPNGVPVHGPEDVHSKGRAIDFVPPGYNPARASEYIKALTDIGFKFAQAEAEGVHGATGDHIHAQLEKGAVVDPTSNGKTVKVAESGRREGIFPANANEPFPFHLDDKQFNKLLSALTGHIDISKKILGSM